MRLAKVADDAGLCQLLAQARASFQGEMMAKLFCRIGLKMLGAIQPNQVNSLTAETGPIRSVSSMGKR